jgi:hypothetical protein
VSGLQPARMEREAGGWSAGIVGLLGMSVLADGRGGERVVMVVEMSKGVLLPF